MRMRKRMRNKRLFERRACDAFPWTCVFTIDIIQWIIKIVIIVLIKSDT